MYINSTTKVPAEQLALSDWSKQAKPCPAFWKIKRGNFWSTYFDNLSSSLSELRKCHLFIFIFYFLVIHAIIYWGNCYGWYSKSIFLAPCMSFQSLVQELYGTPRLWDHEKTRSLFCEPFPFHKKWECQTGICISVTGAIYYIINVVILTGVHHGGVVT